MDGKCYFQGCTRPARALGLCVQHRVQQKSGKPLTPIKAKLRDKNKLANCLITGCNRQPEDKGLCPQHANQARRYKLSPLQLDMLLLPGRCNICDLEARLMIDHDHACCPGINTCGNCVRGILCVGCNTTMGRIDDNPVIINRMLSYLNVT